MPFEVDVGRLGRLQRGQPAGLAPADRVRPLRGRRSGAGRRPNAKGFELVDTEQPGRRSPPTRTARRASPSTTPGWHRIKATVTGASGEETASARTASTSACPSRPQAAAGHCRPTTRCASRRRSKPEEPERGSGRSRRAGTGQPGSELLARFPQRRTPRGCVCGCGSLDRSRIAQGLVKVSWRVLDAGVGDRGMDDLLAGARRKSGSLREQGERHERHLGAAAPAPREPTYRLRMTVVDALGRSSSATARQGPGAGLDRAPSARALALCTLLAVDSAPAGAPNPVNKARARQHDPLPAGNAEPRRRLWRLLPARNRARASAPGSRWRSRRPGSTRADQARPGGVDAYRFLVDHFQKGLEEEIPYPSIPHHRLRARTDGGQRLGDRPASTSPAIDLVDEILARARPDGSFAYVPGGEGAVNDTFFAILALSPVDEPAARGVRSRPPPTGSKQRSRALAAGPGRTATVPPKST